MKFTNINKYLLNYILSYINEKTKLNLVKFNKKLRLKLDITLYSYQKFYFNSIITYTLFSNKDILNKIYDKETLNKLISEFENDIKGIYENKNLFKKVADLETYEIINKAIKSPKIKLPNLIELNLLSLENIELPLIILTNLEKLSLIQIFNLKFITNDSNISLNKLKYLEFIYSIISEENENITINMDNLIYLNIKFTMSDDERKNVKDEVILFENLNKLIEIFNFDFLSLFLTDESVNFFDLISNENLKKKFKNSDELFNQKKIVEKFNFFNFKIEFGIENVTGSVLFGNEFIYSYLFSKTINDKFYFNSLFESYTYGDDSNFKFCQNEIRICNNRNYNNYFFINKAMIIVQGQNIQYLNEELNEQDLNLNNFEIIKNIYCMEFLSLLNKFKDNNNLESMTFDYLDISKENNFLDNLKKFKKLRVFKIKEDLLLSNKQLITLLKCLSEFKYLFNFEYRLVVNPINRRFFIIYFNRYIRK